MISYDHNSDLFQRVQATPEPAPVHELRLGGDGASPAGIGARLRSARAAQGLSLVDCAARLHLPIKVLERLEADDLGAPDHFVFLRGPLTSYGKLLGLPAEACTQALRKVAPSSQPALTSVARISHTRWLLQRYGTATTYIVLTAFIAVPLVLLGLRGGLDRAPTRIVSLDQAQAPRSAPAPDASPFRASMAPFAAIGLGEEASSAPAPVPAPVTTPAPAPGQHNLTLTATGDCWFEITAADGGSVASGMLHAGDTRTWHSDGVLHVKLGNAGVVSVSSDGKPLALAAGDSGKVVRFDAFGAPIAGAND